MEVRRARLAVLLQVVTAATAATAVTVAANDAPVIEHQPSPCTVPGQPISICAAIGDDVAVSVARAYFRKSGEDFYAFVDMTFVGLKYCGTLPAPREGKLKTIEYYLQAVDDEFEPARTSTYQMLVQPEGSCGFPPLERDAERAAAIKVFATNRKQGSQLDKAFDPAGVTFVPVPKR